MVIAILLNIFVMGAIAQGASSPALLNVPEPTTFNDKSALSVKSNLQSQQYQDFIHTLYRFDKDNLKRVDNLFAHPEQVEQSSFNTGLNTAESQQPSYADYIRSQQSNNYFGISQDSTTKIRNERSAQGALFRPLFVYRIFQERTLEKEEERIRRRLLSNRRRTSSHLRNQDKYKQNIK